MESFNTMLDKTYESISSLKNFEKIKLKEPKLGYINNKKCWTDVKVFLKDINRDSEHFNNFLKKQTENTIQWRNSNKREIIFKSKINKMILKKYMVNYIKYSVLCKQCSNMKTILQRDKDVKKFKLICNNCKTNYYI